MEIVTGDQDPVLAPADAVRLLQEMAAVARTIFAVDAHADQSPVTAAPSSGGAVPAATTPDTPGPAAPAAVPTSIPVPGAALLQEIAFLDD